MKIVFTDHLKNRLKQRGIPLAIVRQVFDEAKEYYFDNLRNHHIVIANVLYKEKVRKTLVAYDTIVNVIEAITIHPITNEQIDRRLSSGRWKYEEKQS